MLQLTNYAKTTLSFGIGTTDTTLQIPSADVPKFPALTLPGDWFMAAISNTPTGGATLKTEFVKITAVEDNTFTIERAQENTTAQSFSAGDRVELRLTAGALADLRGNVWERPIANGEVQTPTRLNDTSFSLPGDFAGEFQSYRAVRAYQTVDAQGYVTSATYSGGVTTVVVENMILDTGLALVEYGLGTGMAPKYTHAATADSAADSDNLGGNAPDFYAPATHDHAGTYEPVFSKNSAFNMDVATEIEAEAGEADNKVMTPLTTAQAIRTLAKGSPPPGTMLDWPSSTPPSWALVMDGAEYDRGDYAELFAVIGTLYGVGDGSTTFNVPDFRNLFRRGVPIGGVVGTYQDDAFKSHNHEINMGTSGVTGETKLEINSNTKQRDNLSTLATGDTETRPKNMHVLPIIAY